MVYNKDLSSRGQVPITCPPEGEVCGYELKLCGFLTCAQKFFLP